MASGKVIDEPSQLALRMMAASEVSIRNGEFSIDDVLEALEYTFACVQRIESGKPPRKLH